jgi:hypothetical protein
MRHCAANPESVIRVFLWYNLSSRTMALESTQPLTEISTMTIFWGKRRPLFRVDNLNTSMRQLSWNLRELTSWKPQGLYINLFLCIIYSNILNWSSYGTSYRGADKCLAWPTSRYILFDGENISFEASLVIHINGNNIPPIMIISRIYETQNLL